MEVIAGIALPALIIYVAIALLRRRDSVRGDPASNMRHTVAYQYRRKSFIMTKAENDFFDLLNEIIADSYFIFPQIHLSSLFDHSVHGQTWKGALSYINQKSVDYVICDKQYRRPLLAIELDDWSHDSFERRQRDVNVEHIFNQSGLPLLRLRNNDEIDEEYVTKRLSKILPLIKSTDSATSALSGAVLSPEHDNLTHSN